MKSTSGWEENGNGTNSSSFNGLPGDLLQFCLDKVVGVSRITLNTEQSGAQLSLTAKHTFLEIPQQM